MAALTRSKGTEGENTNDKDSNQDSPRDINEEETQSELEEEQEIQILAEKCIEEFSAKDIEPIQIERRKINANNIRNIKKNDQRKMLKSTLKMNLVTIALLLFLLPRHCLAFYYYQCYVTQGSCTNYLQLFNKAAFLQLCVTFSLPLIVSRLVEQIS